MSLFPRVIALLGFGEAGSAIARGLAAEGGWRGASRPGDNAPRRLIAIDTALDQDARGTALGKQAQALDVAIEGHYTEALREADLVICAVQGEHALEAAAAAAPLLKKGAHYLDLCTVTGRMSDEDRAPIEAAGGRYSDIAVMGGFFKQGIKAPMMSGDGITTASRPHHGRHGVLAPGSRLRIPAASRGLEARSRLSQGHAACRMGQHGIGYPVQTISESGTPSSVFPESQSSYRQDLKPAFGFVK